MKKKTRTPATRPATWVTVPVKKIGEALTHVNRDTLRVIAKNNGVAQAPRKSDLIEKLINSDATVSVSIG